MRRLYQYFDKLTERRVHFCFQSHQKREYYNLSVETPKGSREYVNGESLEEIEKALDIFWGHLLDSSKPTSLPTPPGFPKP